MKVNQLHGVHAQVGLRLYVHGYIQTEKLSDVSASKLTFHRSHSVFESTALRLHDIPLGADWELEEYTQILGHVLAVGDVGAGFPKGILLKNVQTLELLQLVLCTREHSYADEQIIR